MTRAMKEFKKAKAAHNRSANDGDVRGYVKSEEKAKRIYKAYIGTVTGRQRKRNLLISYNPSILLEMPNNA